MSYDKAWFEEILGIGKFLELWEVDTHLAPEALEGSCYFEFTKSKITIIPKVESDFKSVTQVAFLSVNNFS